MGTSELVNCFFKLILIFLISPIKSIFKFSEKHFLKMIKVVLLAVSVLVVTGLDCPPTFHKVDGVDQKRCFHYHGDEQVTFQSAFKLCQNFKGAKVWEPVTFQEGETIFSWVQEKRNSTNIFWMWINYHDIEGS